MKLSRRPTDWAPNQCLHRETAALAPGYGYVVIDRSGLTNLLTVENPVRGAYEDYWDRHRLFNRESSMAHSALDAESCDVRHIKTTRSHDPSDLSR